MEPHSVELRESLFFTARTVALPLASSSSGYSERIYDEMNPKSESSSSSSTSSSSGYSSRIHDVMKLKCETGMSNVDAEIEASKSHWTDTTYHSAPMSTNTEAYHTAPMSTNTEADEDLFDPKLYEENVEVMRRLQREYGRFFEIGGTVSGRMIAEGGQAAIYDGGLRINGELSAEEGEMVMVALKVFKAGYAISDLQKQWPLAFLQKHNRTTGDNFVFTPMMRGRLLDDGRFAFEMMKLWGDLRKLMDARLVENGNCHPPFMKSDGHYRECCILQMLVSIARGLELLHKEGYLHRDLKASNVLVESANWPTDPDNLSGEGRIDPLERVHSLTCVVADYECSIGVVGTGFWRAPEILEAVKNHTVDTIPNLFTPKTDVYSYAMTCYEILTGLVPFEHPQDHRTNIVDVIEGKRPTLPKHLKPWIKELLRKCWHVNPLERPSFEEILSILIDVNSLGLEYHSGSSYFRVHEGERFQSRPTFMITKIKLR